MKLTNYKRGYNDTFDCSIHGTIKMTRDEFDEVVTQLYKWVNPSRFEKNLLYDDLARREIIKDGFRVNVRVTLTEKLIKKFNLSNYKRGNYQIQVCA